jgi:hypothetical protein
MCLAIAFMILQASMLNSQVVQRSAIATKMLYYNSSGLIGQSPEILSSIADSNTHAMSWSMKTLVCFEGTYYQVLKTRKFANSHKVAVRKSTDGVNWSPMTIASNSPDSTSDYMCNIYVWRKNNDVHVGITYGDFRDVNPQIRFALSTNGGNSFLPTIPISSHNDNNYVNLGGMTGRGDTIAVSWTRRVSANNDHTWFSRTTDGGLTWSPMGIVYDGNQYSTVSDITLDNSGNLFTVIADDQFFRINLVVRQGINLGSSWATRAQITNHSSGHVNTLPQIKYFNNKLYATWTHTRTYYDSVNFSISTNSGGSWNSVKISDEDTIHYSSNSGNTFIYLHPSFTVTNSGVIYAVWSDSRERQTYIQDSCQFNVYLTRSTDGGITWSPNTKINGPSNYSRIRNIYASIAIKSSGGIDSVLVSWTKSRNIGTSSISQIGNEIPVKFNLKQNYPNPFNPSTRINFDIPVKGKVQLTVYNSIGQQVAMLVNEVLSPGSYAYSFDGIGMTSGVYFYKLESAGFVETRKMLLVK